MTNTAPTVSAFSMGEAIVALAECLRRERAGLGIGRPAAEGQLAGYIEFLAELFRAEYEGAEGADEARVRIDAAIEGLFP